MVKKKPYLLSLKALRISLIRKYTKYMIFSPIHTIVNTAAIAGNESINQAPRVPHPIRAVHVFSVLAIISV